MVNYHYCCYCDVPQGGDATAQRGENGDMIALCFIFTVHYVYTFLLQK